MVTRRTKKDQVGRRPPKRAAESAGFALDVQSMKLRKLMTEQSKTSEGCATFYSGSQGEFAAAGFPAFAFPTNDEIIGLRINGRDAYIQRREAVYDLTLCWDSHGPWYYDAAHPALAEIARMMHIEMCEWFGTLSEREIPMGKLSRDPRVQYAFPLEARYRFSEAAAAQLSALQSAIYHAILSAEIIPIALPQSLSSQNVVDIKAGKPAE